MGYYQNTLTRLPLWALHRPGDFSKTIKYSVRYLLLTAVLHAFMKPLFQHQCNTGKPDAHDCSIFYNLHIRSGEDQYDVE